MQYEVSIYGNPVLRKKAERVENIDDGIRNLAADMIETLHARNGLGLSAQQVGRTVSLCVIHLSVEYDVKEKGGPRENPDVEMPLVLVNPEITETSGEQEGQEGCLSFPEVFVPITRAEQVTAIYEDLEGKRQTVRARGLLARVIQHEVDHLNGILITDRMSAIKKISLAGVLKKLRKTGSSQENTA